MTLSALGIFSAAGAGGGALSDYELIETILVSGSSTSAITFSNLGTYSSVYKHLQIRSTERQSNAVLESTSTITINGSAGTRSHLLLGIGSNPVISSDEGSRLPFYSTGASEVSGNFAGRVTDILDAYSTTKNKSFRVLAGFSSSSYNRIFFQSGLWANTNSITSITFTSAANYVAGSRFSIYGIKG
jgi:hypothetical protein